MLEQQSEERALVKCTETLAKQELEEEIKQAEVERRHASTMHSWGLIEADFERRSASCRKRVADLHASFPSPSCPKLSPMAKPSAAARAVKLEREARETQANRFGTHAVGKKPVYNRHFVR